MKSINLSNMKTIKLPLQNKIDITKLQQQFSNVVRFAYNRFVDGKDQKEIRNLCKSLKNVELMNSWFIQCAIMKGKTVLDTRGSKVIFGGKQNYFDRVKKQISKEEFKENRLMNINSQGDIRHCGNRFFKFQVIEENAIIFKPNRKKHIRLLLPKLRNNIKKELFNLQKLMENKELPVTIDLNEKFIFITFEETKLQNDKNKTELLNDRVLGLDLNPNNIGLNISSFDDKEEQKILHTCLFDLSYYNRHLGVTSNSKQQKYQNDKFKHLLFEVCKKIEKLAIHYKCSKICLEDLSFKNANNKNKEFNRLTKNRWFRNLVCTNLKKRCKVSNIEFVTVNPAYSSFIGNLVYNKFPDAINASLEISRRAYYKYVKNKFFPELNKSLYDQRKKPANLKDCSTWKELFDMFKNSKLRYRVSLENCKPSKVFSLFNINSRIIIYDFISN